MYDCLYTLFFNKRKASSEIKSVLYILLFAFITINQTDAQTTLKGLPIINTFSTEEYQGGIQNWDITQGANDLLYVANNFGLLVYDGESWKALPIEASTRLLSVACSTYGLIYVGGQGDLGYFQTTQDHKLSYVSLKDKLPSEYQSFNEIWKIYTLDDAAYFLTFQHIFKLKGESLEVIDPKVTLGFSFKVRNQIYVQVPSQGLMKLSNNSLTPIKNGEDMKGKDIRGIIPFDMNSTLLATQNQGLFLMHNTSIVPWEITSNEWLKKAQINSIQLLSSNLYAIGTQNEGILIIDQLGNIVQLLSKDRGLTDNTILSLFEDRFGNLWAGLNNGIAIIELNQPFTLINDGLELSGTGYTAYKTASNVYLGTNNGLFVLEDQSKNNLLYPQYKKIPATEGQTYSLQMLDDDLILGHHQGAILVNPNTASSIKNTEQGVWKIESLPNSNSTFIAGSYTGMHLLEKKNDEWGFTQKIEGFQESSRKFEIVDTTTIWVSHGYKGIYRLTFKDNFTSLANTKFYGVDDGLPSNLLNNVFRVENRLVFAAEVGIYEYDATHDKFIQDSVLSTHFANQHIREIEEDIKGNLYFITDDELGVLKKNPIGKYEKESTIFQKILPLVSDDLENITVIDSENVLINAKEGFIHYNPSLNNTSAEDFWTEFREISWADSILHGGYELVANQTEAKTQVVKLPFSKNAIHFHYASVFFEGNYDAEYQYKLEKFDNEWSKWSVSSEKEYTNLPSGNYTFQVRSRNSAGVLSNTAQFSFKILPPWYANTIAYFIYTFLLLSLFGLGLFVQNRHQKKKQRSIVADANKTILEKETELKKVTSKSEKEITQLKNEHLEAELKHKNHQLTSSAVHLINKNELMSNLKSEINHLLKENDPQAISKGLKKVVKSIEKNIAEDETWSQFEIHFDQVHGDFIKKLRESYPSLTPQELKLSAFLRMNMSSKEIAHLLNISVRGVEVSRYRLRKKLPIESHENLIEFMMNIS